MIIEEIRLLVKRGLNQAAKENSWKIPSDLQVQIERPKNEKFGDWSSNVALILSSKIDKPAQKIAGEIKDALSGHKYVLKADVAGPGFINIYLKDDWYRHLVPLVIGTGKNYGKTRSNKGKINLEFVSANPVGPLHIGHGRWAAIGDALANVLEATGFEVSKEFYVNDYGRQMSLFGQSVEAAYLNLIGVEAAPPEEGYTGSYIERIAELVKDKFGTSLKDSGNRADAILEFSYKQALNNIKKSLKNFGLVFDNFYSERELHKSGKIRTAIAQLKKDGFTFEKDNALWFKSSELGDEKDRVIVRSNNEPTYFAADIAYHADKLERGFTKLINIWGADHHGYVARLKAAVRALGYDPQALEVLLGQLVRLVKSGEPVKMSKRAGEYVTFDELIGEVGKDATRYTFLTQSIDSNLDFDLDLVKEKSSKNPVYYVQYAYARICNVFKFAEENGIKLNKLNQINKLTEEPELKLIKEISRFEEVVQKAAERRAPHLLTVYAAELATSFHYFYSKCRIIIDDLELSQERLNLVESTRITLKNLLSLLGVSSPEKM